MVKQRDPLQVSPEFKRKLNMLKGKLLANGMKEKDVSLRILTEKISDDIIFSDIEKKILGGKDIHFRIKFDGRKK